jgi:hypothetical protein
MKTGRDASATPCCVVRYENPPDPLPLLAAEPPEPPFAPAHFTVTETTGIFFLPELRTTIVMFDVVASRCLSGKLADTIRTGNLPLGSLAS